MSSAENFKNANQDARIRMVNELTRSITRVRAEDFLRTEMGGDFDPSTLQIDDAGDTFTLEVMSGFRIAGTSQSFKRGEIVAFDRNANII